MASITLSVPEDVRKLMKKHPEINWSALVRKTIIAKTKELSLKEQMKEELGEESEFNDWAVKLVREGRK